jgi:hypothetical protein
MSCHPVRCKTAQRVNPAVATGAWLKRRRLKARGNPARVAVTYTTLAYAR